MKHAALSCVALGLLVSSLFTTTQTARADVEFSTFAPGNGQGYGPGYAYSYNFALVRGTNSEYDGADDYTSAADEFTASFTGMLSSVDVAIEGFADDYRTDSVFTVVLYQNLPTLGYPLTSSVITLGTLAVAPHSDEVVTLTTSGAGVPLVSGVSYWLGLLPSDSYTLAAWLDSEMDLSPSDYSLDGGASYTTSNDGSQAFDINATPDLVPEPSTWAMILGGIGLLGWMRRPRGRRA